MIYKQLSLHKGSEQMKLRLHGKSEYLLISRLKIVYSKK